MQTHISESLAGLDFISKYNLSEYNNPDLPLVIFGMYREEDLKVYLEHRSDVTLVWQGSDAKNLQWIDEIKSRHAKHYAISSYILRSLDEYGIHSTYAPISATQGKATPIPRGNSIYFYTSRSSQETADFYGENLIPEVQQRTGLTIIKGTFDLYKKSELREIYRNCFINLRLTPYDGCPNSNLEMGLLGRRSIFNGDIPGSIKWNNIIDLCESITKEYYKRNEDNREIAELTEIYINSTNNIFYENNTNESAVND